MQQPDDPLPQQVIKEIHHYHGGGGDVHRPSFGRLLDAIIPMAIAALVGVVWMLSNSVTKLAEQLLSQNQMNAVQFSNLNKKVDELSVEVKSEQ